MEPCFICGRTGAKAQSCLSAFDADVLEVVATAMRFAGAQGADAVTTAHVLHALATASAGRAECERRGIDRDRLRRSLSEDFAREVIAGRDAAAGAAAGRSLPFHAEFEQVLADLTGGAHRALTIGDLLDGLEQARSATWRDAGAVATAAAQEAPQKPAGLNGNHADPWMLAPCRGSEPTPQSGIAMIDDPIWGRLPADSPSDIASQAASVATAREARHDSMDVETTRDARQPDWAAPQPAREAAADPFIDLLEQVRRDAAVDAPDRRSERKGVSPEHDACAWDVGRRHVRNESSDRELHRSGRPRDRVSSGGHGSADMHEHLDRIIYLLSEQGSRLDALEREIREARVRWRESGTEEWRGGGVHRIRRTGASSRGRAREAAETAVIVENAARSDVSPSAHLGSEAAWAAGESASGKPIDMPAHPSRWQTDTRDTGAETPRAHRSMTSGLLRGDSASSPAGWGRRSASERVSRTHGVQAIGPGGRTTTTRSSSFPADEKAASARSRTRETSEDRDATGLNARPQAHEETVRQPSPGISANGANAAGMRDGHDDRPGSLFKTVANAQAHGTGEARKSVAGNGFGDGAGRPAPGSGLTANGFGPRPGSGAGNGEAHGGGKGSGAGAGNGRGNGSGNGYGFRHGQGYGQGADRGTGSGTGNSGFRERETGAVGEASSRTDRNGEGDEAANEREKRFYLALGDDVVDAPSIGPRTAERLYPAGVRTVRDLLTADPDDLATRVSARHITPEVIANWQDQARLVCTVPWLRGTHAQLLVGAGYRLADEVANAGGAAVVAAIARFAETRQGERVLRGGPVPERERIGAWVEHAALAEPWRGTVET